MEKHIKNFEEFSLNEKEVSNNSINPYQKELNAAVQKYGRSGVKYTYNYDNNGTILIHNIRRPDPRGFVIWATETGEVWNAAANLYSNNKVETLEISSKGLIPKKVISSSKTPEEMIKKLLYKTYETNDLILTQFFVRGKIEKDLDDINPDSDLLRSKDINKIRKKIKDEIDKITQNFNEEKKRIKDSFDKDLKKKINDLIDNVDTEEEKNLTKAIIHKLVVEDPVYNITYPLDKKSKEVGEKYHIY